MNKRHPLTEEQLSTLRFDIYQSLSESILALSNDTEQAYKDGIEELPDFAAHCIEDQYKHIISIQNTLELLGVDTKIIECDQKYYNFHWSEIYNWISDEAKKQWEKRLGEILSKNLPLAEDYLKHKENKKL